MSLENEELKNRLLVESHKEVVRKFRKKQLLSSEKYLLTGSTSNAEQKRIFNDIKHKDAILKELMAPPALAEDQSGISPDETDLEEYLDELHALVEAKKKKVNTITTNLIDFVPVIGSAKMIVEGLRGKQYGTDHEIHGMHRALHAITGAAFLALDLTGAGVIASELGKGVFKIGERALLKKTGEAVSREVLEKETATLLTRAEKRIASQEKIANAEDGSRNIEAHEADPMILAKCLLSKNQFNDLSHLVNGPRKQIIMNSLASTLRERRLTKKEIISGVTLASGLYLTVPAAVSLSQASVLGTLAPTLTQAVTAIQGSSVASMVLPASTLATLSGLSSTTFGALFLTLPLITQVALVVPPTLAALYVASKAYRGVRNVLNERAFKKQFGISVSNVLKKS